MKRLLLVLLCISLTSNLFAQNETDSAKVEKLRSESGVDPTRVMTRVSYSIVATDPQGPKAIVGNRIAMTLGVGRWSMSGKFELASKVGEEPGTGFETGLNDFKFSMLFWSKEITQWQARWSFHFLQVCRESERNTFPPLHPSPIPIPLSLP